MKHLALVLALLSAGCAGQTHIGEYKPKKRDYQSPPAAASDKEASPGTSPTTRNWPPSPPS